MNEMIERAAKAYYEKWRKHSIADGLVGAWDELSPRAKALYTEPMRAAIAAMREPAADMIESGNEVEDDFTSASIPRIWRAMIDEALRD